MTNLLAPLIMSYNFLTDRIPEINNNNQIDDQKNFTEVDSKKLSVFTLTQFKKVR